ncbi:acyltransferase [bacterium]|nr:acyltransferase [bacterium]
MTFLSREQLERMGFKSLGEDVKVSDKASIYNAANISIGDHSRVDDFSILSAGTGGISIGRYCHVACHSTLIGKAPIVLEDYVALSAHVAIFSSTDDFSGRAMANPTLPEEVRHVIHGNVTLHRFSAIGANSVILPGVDMGEGAALGALSLARASLEPFGIYVGAPARKVSERKRDLLEVEKQFRSMLMARTA